MNTVLPTNPFIAFSSTARASAAVMPSLAPTKYSSTDGIYSSQINSAQFSGTLNWGVFADSYQKEAGVNSRNKLFGHGIEGIWGDVEMSYAKVWELEKRLGNKGRSKVNSPQVQFVRGGLHSLSSGKSKNAGDILCESGLRSVSAKVVKGLTSEKMQALLSREQVAQHKVIQALQTIRLDKRIENQLNAISGFGDTIKDLRANDQVDYLRELASLLDNPKLEVYVKVAVICEIGRGMEHIGIDFRKEFGLKLVDKFDASVLDLYKAAIQYLGFAIRYFKPEDRLDFACELREVMFSDVHPLIHQVAVNSLGEAIRYLPKNQMHYIGALLERFFKTDSEFVLKAVAKQVGSAAEYLNREDQIYLALELIRYLQDKCYDVRDTAVKAMIEFMKHLDSDTFEWLFDELIEKLESSCEANRDAIIRSMSGAVEQINNDKQEKFASKLRSILNNLDSNSRIEVQFLISRITKNKFNSY